MRNCLLIMLLFCIILTGCANTQNQQETSTDFAIEESIAETTSQIQPLPDNTMESLDNSIINISFTHEDLYQDNSGKIFLRMQIYSYDKFDMVDISGMKAGDTILISGEEIPVNTVERNDYGTVLVNGGLDEGGVDLSTEENGIYFVHGYSDMKTWNLLGQAERPISLDFVFTDTSNLELGPVTYDVEALLNDLPEMNYGFQPQNTTVRIENGQVIAMDRIYTP